MGIVKWVRNWLENTPAQETPTQETPTQETPTQDTYEKAQTEWAGSYAYSKERHAWFQRENQCAGSGEAPVSGSVRTIQPLLETKRRKRKGMCRVCEGDFSVSRSTKIAAHKERT